MEFGTKLKLKKDLLVNDYITLEKDDILQVAEYKHQRGMKLHIEGISLVNFPFNYNNRDKRINEYFEVVHELQETTEQKKYDIRITDKDNLIVSKHIDYLKSAASNGYGLCSHGFIYKVLEGFIARLNHTFYIKNGIVITTDLDQADFKTYKEKFIKAGSLIEFRYEYAAHCRDIDDDYWMIDPAILALKCTPYAQINKDTKFEGKLNLKEILELKKYIKLAEVL